MNISRYETSHHTFLLVVVMFYCLNSAIIILHRLRASIMFGMSMMIAATTIDVSIAIPMLPTASAPGASVVGSSVLSEKMFDYNTKQMHSDLL